MLKYIGMDDIKNNKTASKILLTIAYATGLGGLASPLGGAMNLVTVDYIQKITGKEYMYSSWVVRFLPIMIVLILINILFTIRDVKRTEMLGGSKEYFVARYKELEPMSYEEKAALILFVLATVLAFARQLYQRILPGLKPAYVFIICAIVSFLLTNKKARESWFGRMCRARSYGGLCTYLPVALPPERSSTNQELQRHWVSVYQSLI